MAATHVPQLLSIKLSLTMFVVCQAHILARAISIPVQFLALLSRHGLFPYVYTAVQTLETLNGNMTSTLQHLFGSDFLVSLLTRQPLVPQKRERQNSKLTPYLLQ